MTSEIYLAIIVSAACGLWFVWDLGLKKLFLDWFRESLFELRFRLFSMAESGELPFDDEAYRAIETLLCGLLRLAHRITFVSVILTIMEQEDAKKARDYIDYHQQIEMKIARTPRATQEKLRTILIETSKMVRVYAAISSLFFMVAAVVISVLKALNVMGRIGKAEISVAIESEAYRAESRRPISRQAALA